MRWLKKAILKEHLSLTREPESAYIGHVTPVSGSTENLKEGIIGFFRDRYDTEKFKSLRYLNYLRQYLNVSSYLKDEPKE